MTEQTEAQPELRADDQQRREQAARRARGIGHRAEGEPKQQNERQDGKCPVAVERALRDRIAAADQVGREPCQRADRGPDRARPQLERPMLQARRDRDRPEQRAVVADREKPGESTQRDIERDRRGARESQRIDMEIRGIAVHHARHEDRAGRSGEGGDRHAGFEPPHQFLEHEYRARGGRVESGGKASARAGRNQRPGVRPFQAGQFSRHMGDDRTHLHARTFTAERQPRPDREQAADELDRQHHDRRRWHVFAQHRFDVGNSAPGRFRRVAADQAGRERNRGRAAGGYEQEAHDRCRVRPADQRVTPCVRVVEENAEYGSDRAGSGAHDTRQQHEQDQAAVAVFEIGGGFLIGIHRLWNPTSNPPAAASSAKAVHEPARPMAC